MRFESASEVLGGFALGTITRLTGSGLLWKVALISYSVNLSFRLQPELFKYLSSLIVADIRPKLGSHLIKVAPAARVRREC